MIKHSCSNCGFTAYNDEELSNFPINKCCKDGYSTFCKPCFNTLYNHRRVYTHGVWHVLPKNPRTNICEMCGKTVAENSNRQMSLHHIKYDSKNPLKYTVELCISCHNSIRKYE